MQSEQTLMGRADTHKDEHLPARIERVVGEIQALLGEFQAAPVRRARLVLASAHADARVERQARRLAQVAERQG